MTDIDFDELDRAVNSLMQPKQPTAENSQPNKPLDGSTANAEAVATEQPEPAMAQEVSQSPAVSVDAAPTVSDDSSAAVEPVLSNSETMPADQSKSVTPPKITTKKRGQFMDVMHSSSNMKQSDPAPKLAPRRESITLQPATPEASRQAKFVSEPVKTSGLNKPPDATSEQIPDPIDMITEPEEETPAQTATETPAVEVDSQSVEAQLDAAIADTEPLSSPFIPDAKVEKRPLGGIQPESLTETEPVPDPDLVETEKDETQEDTDPAVLPEELQQDVLAIESDETSQVDQAAAVPDPEVPSQPPVIQPVESKVEAKPAPVQKATLSGSLPQSLPVQPADKNEDDSHPDNSIFDTEQYQAPIKHPVKKKSGWPVILAIVGLVLLGTGGGVAFFLLSNGY